MAELSHVDEAGRARMVDVSGKPLQRRIALASGHIRMAAATVEAIRANLIKKGDVLAVAEIAGIQAAKRTPELIPLCHTIHIASVRVRAVLDDDGVSVESEVVAMDQTGVEMEALSAVSVALLAVYDMCKAVDKEMTIDRIVLIEKRKENLE